MTENSPINQAAQSIKRGLRQISDHFHSDDYLFPLMLFVINFILVFPLFLPNLSDINPWDEAAYINSGRLLLDSGRLPSFAGNPLTNLFYALTYLPFKNSPFWMVHSCSLGRVLLFSLLWLSAYLIAKQLRGHARPFIMLGFLFVTPLAIDTLRFPSDPLFTSLAAISLSHLLHFYRSRKVKQLWLASLFMGLASLARNDGLVLFLILFVLSMILNLRTKRWWPSLIATTVPFLALVGGYVLIYGALTGNFKLGTQGRTYGNFESGQQIIYSGTGELSPVIESRLEARRIFGTPEENHYSVFKAIRRNPQVFMQRVIAVTKSLPQTLLHAYGIRFAILFFLLALRGIIELLRRREFLLLAILCLWPASLLSGFVITIFRTGHLQFYFYIIFALAAIGLTAVLSNLENRTERSLWTIILLGFTLYGCMANKLAVSYGTMLFLVSLWTIQIVQLCHIRLSPAVPLFILLCTGIIIRGNYPSPKIRTLGIEPQEQAVVYMRENLESMPSIAAGSPGVVEAAKKRCIVLSSTDIPINRSPEEFIKWMIGQGIEAIYVDHALYNSNPALWDMIQPQIGKRLERVFAADEGSFQILIVQQGS
jgi:hypothetical protein